MKFRMGLFLGLAAGYVLGARAGRARYEQIAALWGQVLRTPQAQQLGTEVKSAAASAAAAAEEKATEGMAKVTELVRDARS